MSIVVGISGWRDADLALGAAQSALALGLDTASKAAGAAPASMVGSASTQLVALQKAYEEQQRQRALIAALEASQGKK